MGSIIMYTYDVRPLALAPTRYTINSVLDRYFDVFDITFNVQESQHLVFINYDPSVSILHIVGWSKRKKMSAQVSTSEHMGNIV
jgi:hypothetical protein